MTDNRPDYMTPQPVQPVPEQPVVGQYSIAPEPKRGSAGIKAGIAGVAVLALVGGGIAWADPFDWRKTSAAEGPAIALPADAQAYLAVDFDPSMGQKLDMVRFAMKFPALKEKVNLNEQGDIKKQLFEAMTKNSGCDKASYDADIAPWVGEQMAVAKLPKMTDPVVVIEAKDEAKAKDGIRKFGQCGGGNSEMGLAYVNGYLVATGKQAEADKVVTDAKASPLSKRAEFTEDFDKVGEAGIVNFWGTVDGLKELSESATVNDMEGQVGGVSAGEVDWSQVTFRSGAGTVRFTDGNPELKFVAKSTTPLKTSDKHTAVGDLPADSTIAFGVAGGAQGVQEAWPQVKKQLEAQGGDLSSIEQQLNLKLPDDLSTLLGDDLRVAVGALDMDKLNAEGPEGVPAGIALTTDRAKLEELVLRTKVSQVNVKIAYGDKTHGVAMNDQWAQKLSQPSGDKLSGVSDYTKAVADADKAQAVTYVNVRSLVQTLGKDMPAKERENIDPISSVGISATVESGDYSAGTVRVVAK